MKNAHKIGAIFFIIWGIIHVVGGTIIIADVSDKGASSTLAILGPLVLETEIPNEPGTIVTGVLLFHGYNILWLGLISIVIAMVLNWKNSVVGFWLNLAIVGFADVGLILFLVSPGLLSWMDGAPGPMLFICATTFSYLGLKNSTDMQERMTH